MTIIVRRCEASDMDAWSAMRIGLWPFLSDDPGSARAPELLTNPDMSVFLAISGERPIGFAEAALRRDYVNGCDTSPVGFLEGIYIEPDWRGRGAARMLAAAAERWVRDRGCTEFASDALIDNLDSHAMHEALGFEETERVVYFLKRLA